MTSDKDRAAASVGGGARRLIFLSHAVADRKLAAALKSAVTEAYSDLVDVYASSDASPAGGLMPGDDWFDAIHARLSVSQAVWVLATPTSIRHPWLYWEAGIGRTACPFGISVLRVGLPVAQLPSPLSAYQSYDGLRVGDSDTIDTMFNKVGEQIGMKLPPVLVEDVMKRWLGAAGAHQPEEDEPTQQVQPEQVTLLEGLISRLDGAVQRLESRDAVASPNDGRTFSAIPRWQLTSRSIRRERARQAEARGVASASGSTQPPRDFGFIRSFEELVSFTQEHPAAQPLTVDEDADVVVRGGSALAYLRGDWFEELYPEDVTGPVQPFVRQLRQVLQRDEERSLS